MNPNVEMAIVYIIVFGATFITWKLIRDFYRLKFHKIVSNLIAIITATFMFLSTMSLFIPKNYQRGITPESELSITSIAIVVIMMLILYIFFRYLPNKK